MADEHNNARYRLDLQLINSQPDHQPAAQGDFEVFLRVLHKPAPTVVPPRNPGTPLDLDQRAARQVGEVSTPFPFRMKPVFTLKRRPIKAPPEEQELRFESGGRHDHAGVSNFPYFPLRHAIRQRQPPTVMWEVEKSNPHGNRPVVATSQPFSVARRDSLDHHGNTNHGTTTGCDKLQPMLLLVGFQSPRKENENNGEKSTCCSSWERLDRQR